MNKEIKFYQDKITEYRNELINSVINSIHDYNSFFENINELDEYLNTGEYYTDSPVFVQKYLEDRDDYFNKGQCLSFSDIIHFIEASEDISKEEVYNEYIIPTLKYIKEYKNCIVSNNW